MYSFTFYWENKDFGQPYFYVQMTVHEERVSDLESHLSAEEFTLPLPVASVEDIKELAEGTILKYCGKASYERVQGRVPKYIQEPLAAFFKTIRKKEAKKPLSLDNIVIPDYLPDDLG